MVVVIVVVVVVVVAVVVVVVAALVVLCDGADLGARLARNLAKTDWHCLGWGGTSHLANLVHLDRNSYF